MDDVPGTAGADPQGDPSPDTPVGQPVGATDLPEAFEQIDPSKLPPELKAIHSRMHRGYTKALDKIKGRQPDLDLVDQYRTNPEFARQFLAQEAQRLGLSLTQAAQPPARNGVGVPADFIDGIAAELPDELRWMAQKLGPALYKQVQAQLVSSMAPLIEQTKMDRRARAQETWEELASELSDKAPGWEEHEDDMNELLDFLRGPDMRHKRFGSKLEFLYGGVTRNAHAIREAVQRQGDAARFRTSQGGPGRTTTANIDEQIAKAPTNRDAWKLAGQAAIQKMREAGMALPQG